MFLNGWNNTLRAERHYNILIKAECSSENGAEDIYLYSKGFEITDKDKKRITKAARKYLNDPKAYIDSIFIYWSR